MRALFPFLMAASIVSSAALAGADDTGDASKPGLTASRTLTVVAEVTAIDHETRLVTIEDEDGGSFTFEVGEDVRNLDQVDAGDFVIAQIYQEVDIQVKANPEGLEPGVVAEAAVGRAEKGERPAGAVGSTVQVSGVVTAIDLASNTYTLRGPRGNEMTFEAMNPDNLRRGAVGDLVVVTITQSLGVLVERPAEP